jgi:hypothetical protein
MRNILWLLLLTLFLQGCETTNTSGGNINFKGDTARIPIAESRFYRQ